MSRNRLEAFSDGVIAIIITIMVLELEVPHGPTLHDLRELVPTLATYVLSFVYVGIYWSNHHHLFHTVDRVSGGILWANLHLLFWLSLVPFVTAWMGEYHDDRVPAAIYGVDMLGSAIAYTVLVRTIIAHQGPHSKLRAAIGRDRKGIFSLVAYLCAIACAFVNPWIADAIFVGVAGVWLVPDRRIEVRLKE